MGRHDSDDWESVETLQGSDNHDWRLNIGTLGKIGNIDLLSRASNVIVRLFRAPGGTYTSLSFSPPESAGRQAGAFLCSRPGTSDFKASECAEGSRAPSIGFDVHPRSSC